MSFKNGKFFRLTVITEVRPDVFLCRCVCGTEFEVWRSLLACKLQRACEACQRKNPGGRKGHGHVRTFKRRDGSYHILHSWEYNSWNCARMRCENLRDPAYETYGGRGIRMCNRWTLPWGEGFRNFIADMGPRPADKTLDRKNPQGHYEPGNCQWADDQTQYKNQRRWIVAAGGKIGRVESITEVNLRLAKEREEFNRGLTMDREGEDLVY